MIQGKTENRNSIFLNATAIKLLASVLMFLDHIYEMFQNVGAPMWLHGLGRPVFPLFLFLAADSFYYTHSKIAYIKRLLLASMGMTVLTTVTQRLVPNPSVVLMNNAFGTFFVAAVYMLAWDTLKAGIRKKNGKKIGKAILIGLLPVLLMLPYGVMILLTLQDPISATAVQAAAFFSMLLPGIASVEGGPLYVLLGLLFYIFRQHRLIQMLILAGYSVFFLLAGDMAWAVIFAIIPMLLYNGKKGRGMKHFFYIFYPTHIIGLYLLATVVMNGFFQ